MSTQKKALVAIDSWKLSIFERHLSQSGYIYNVGPGLTEGTLFITVKTENLSTLEDVVLAANTEAAKTGAPK